MKDVRGFIESLGGLHDSTLGAFEWFSQDSRLEIVVHDLYQNFEGMPEYIGEKNGRFSFFAVSSLEVCIEFSEPMLRIYDWLCVDGEDGGIETEITFSPGGRISFKWIRSEWSEL